jgi:hypothetical protein
MKMNLQTDRRVEFLRHRSNVPYRAFRADAALSGAGVLTGIRLRVTGGCRTGFSSCEGILDASHHLPGGINAETARHSDAYIKLKAVLDGRRWKSPSGQSKRERTVSIVDPPPGWTVRESGITVPLYEAARSAIGRTHLYKLLTSAEPQKRALNALADHAVEGNLERQKYPGLKEAFSEKLNAVQALTSNTPPATQDNVCLVAALQFLSFFAQRTAQQLDCKREESKQAGSLLRKQRIEQSCDLLNDDRKILVEQCKEAMDDAHSYFQTAEANTIAREISSAESAVEKSSAHKP